MYKKGVLTMKKMILIWMFIISSVIAQDTLIVIPVKVVPSTTGDTRVYFKIINNSPYFIDAAYVEVYIYGKNGEFLAMNNLIVKNLRSKKHMFDYMFLENVSIYKLYKWESRLALDVCLIKDKGKVWSDNFVIKELH